MTGLPNSLSIALWLVGAVWLVALLAHALDASQEIVLGALAFGVLAGIVEWVTTKAGRR
jgi:hypothetical protein